MTQVSFLQNPQDMHAQQKKNIHLGNKTLCENKFTLELRHVNIVFFFLDQLWAYQCLAGVPIFVSCCIGK